MRLLFSSDIYCPLRRPAGRFALASALAVEFGAAAGSGGRRFQSLVLIWQQRRGRAQAAAAFFQENAPTAFNQNHRLNATECAPSSHAFGGIDARLSRRLLATKLISLLDERPSRSAPTQGGHKGRPAGRSIGALMNSIGCGGRAARFLSVHERGSVQAERRQGAAPASTRKTCATRVKFVARRAGGRSVGGAVWGDHFAYH